MNVFFKYILLLVLIVGNDAKCQNQVAITIDDVPNVKKYKKDNYQSLLLNKLDRINIPISIFINEDKLTKTDSLEKNIQLLKKWINRKYVTVGNHTFSHSRYSEVGYENFVRDVEEGEILTKKFSNKYHKDLKYFRFPYNDLGKDSLQHIKIEEYFEKRGYSITPFTIESIDWMYNSVYEYYLENNDFKRAEEIGQNYVAKTLEYFDFFEKLAQKKYNRTIKHIYLCHDNSINEVFLETLIKELKRKSYSFISLEDSLQDDVYKQKDKYYKKWGISWIYRWMKTQEERKSYMLNEPSTQEIEDLYQKLVENKKR